MINIIEHGRINEQIERIKNLPFEGPTERIQELKYLGINKELEANYYVGLSWLIENELAIAITPKIKDVDFLKIFMNCFNCQIASKMIGDIYYIDFNKPKIKFEITLFEITPLLILHFLSLVIKIAQKGLKRNYIQTEGNLKNKIKGKHLINVNSKLNVFKGRIDRNYCRFQDYSIDCIENRIIKKALSFVSSYINYRFKQFNNLIPALNYCLSAFKSVSDNIDNRQIKQIRINPLYRDYKEAIKLSQMILKRFSYSIDETNKETEHFHPFWINMPLLFEIYVLSLLKTAYSNNIIYQVTGHKNVKVDFMKIDENIIIDAKYKKIYDHVKDDYEISDIRQLSAYSRDIAILNKLNLDMDFDTNLSKVIDCLIIYPDVSGLESFNSVKGLKENKINHFINFYKIGVKLPIINYLIKN